MGEEEKPKPINFNLELDPKQIEKHLIEAMVGSAMGPHIKEAVAGFFEKETGYQKDGLSPLDRIVRSTMREEVGRLISRVVQEKKDLLAEKVRELLTDEVVNQFISDAWEAISKKIREY